MSANSNITFIHWKVMFTKTTKHIHVMLSSYVFHFLMFTLSKLKPFQLYKKLCFIFSITSIQQQKCLNSKHQKYIVNIYDRIFSHSLRTKCIIINKYPTNQIQVHNEFYLKPKTNSTSLWKRKSHSFSFIVWISVQRICAIFISMIFMLVWLLFRHTCTSYMDVWSNIFPLFSIWFISDFNLFRCE